MEGISGMDKIKLGEVLNPDFGFAFKRISKAFHDYGDVEWVSPEKADAVIIHVVGGGEYNQALELKNAVVIQHCVFTTQVTIPMWEKIWCNSLLNVSFHDLSSYSDKKFNSISTPWGAEPSIFHYIPYARDNTVFATGHVASTEHLDSIYRACGRTGKQMLHTGENFKWNTQYYKYLKYMSDSELCSLFNHTKYIGCLRDIEGFEMMGIEGAFCGATPIVPDLPTYRWYKDFGKFIDMKQDIVEQLVAIFDSPFQELTTEKRQEVTARFSWKNIIPKIIYSIKGVL